MGPLDDLVGRARSIKELREQIRQVVARATDVRRLPPLLLQGETGTGKNLVAHMIHKAGPRGDGPFVDVNCAAIPEGLLEAELFGFERGAFTDARQRKAGLFQTANGGTLFLDEIALLPESLQAKLLKVIEDRTVRRLGSTRSEVVDVWIMAAANEDLRAAMNARRFREDLYHRLAVLTLRLPPLRDRADDIPLLAAHLLAQICRDYGLPAKALTPDALDALTAYRWPGNVRELINVLERAALLTESARIPADVLDLAAGSPGPARGAGPEPEASFAARVESWERQELLGALDVTNWNVVRAAARLGITRGTMRYRLAKHGFERSTPRTRQRRSTPPHSAAAAEPPPVMPRAVTRWERRLVVLLCAISDFGLDFDTVVQKLESFGGRLEDAGAARIVASFGVDASEDAARRAALAALAIRNALATRGTRMRRAPIVIAIHADTCPVGDVAGRAVIDADARRGMTVILDELSGHGDADTIVVSDAARLLLASRFDFEPGGGAAKRGVRLRGHAQERVTCRGARAPFVGRQRELQTLREHWREARDGRGQIVAVIGEPGIGKSRLLFELRHSLIDEALYLEGRGESYGSGIPYLPVVTVLRDLFGIDDRDAPPTTAEKVGARLAALDPALAPDLAPLLAMLDASAADPEWQTLEPAQRRQRTLHALTRLVVQLSLARPVLLAIEDVHWIDAETQAFLDRLAVSLPGARVLLVITSRPGYRHLVPGPTAYTQLHLDPLSSASAEELVRGLAGADASLEPLRRTLIARTEGNPFFLEETVRTLVETGDLVGEPGAYRATSDATTLQVPATVRAVLSARIDRLAPETRHVVHAAAVIGRDVPLSLLLAIAGVPEAALRSALTDLQAAEFLRETRLVPDVEYRFKHALTHEVAYGALLPELQRDLHAKVVDALEAAHGDRLNEHGKRLAHHALAAELWPKALSYCRQAGAKAAWQSAHREAVQYFEQALGAIRRVPDALARREETLDLYLQLRWSLVPLGDYHKLAESLRSAAALAEELNDPLRLGEISQSMANYLRLVGDRAGALEAAERARAIATAIGNPLLHVRATYQLGMILRQTGDYRGAISALQQVADALRGDLLYERFGEPSVLSVHARAWLAMTLVDVDVGQVSDRLPHFEEALQIAIDAKNTFSETTACLALGSAHAACGDFERGAAFLERAFSLCRDGNFGLLVSSVAAALGAALMDVGRLEEAGALLELAVENATSSGRLGGHALHLVELGEARLRSGRAAEAAELAQRALAAARRHKERGNEARALWLLGEVSANAGQPDHVAAAGYYAEARALADAIGLRRLAARCAIAPAS
jgi:DNA-binding NtrC family response regulator/tetratricopeptide (TPR) repeat protein